VNKSEKEITVGLMYRTARRVYCQEWIDKRLAWDASEFGNITHIIVKSENMWVPDLVLINR